MPGTYVLDNAAASKFMFNLRAGNNEVILTSQLYTSKEGAQKGIESVRANAPDDDQYERKVASDNSPYFVLKAKNGETIGKSEMYSSAQARDNGIASVKANAPNATVVDRTTT